MGEARMRQLNGTATMLDMSVSDSTIRAAKREFCKHLSERLLVSMMNDTTSAPEVLNERAWKLAELHYDEMIRRTAMPHDAVTLSERMAADQVRADFKP